VLEENLDLFEEEQPQDPHHRSLNPDVSEDWA